MLMNSVRVRNSIIIVSSINSVSYTDCAYDMYTYISNCLLVCHTFIHVGTYMFLCNYNAFFSSESLCWIICNYSKAKNQRLGVLYTRYILCSLLPCITSRMPHLASYYYKKERPPLF